SPRAAVAHAAAHVGGDRIVYHPHPELGCFVVERRRGPGERGGSTLVEVRAHGDDFGCRLELRPREPNSWVPAGAVALVVLGVASLAWQAIALHLFVPLTLMIQFALKRHRRRLQPRIDDDRLEIEAAVRRTFAPV